jgi:hypothetical protein
LLTIRNGQLDVFRRAALDTFVERMIRFLHDSFPNVAPPPDAARIERELARARGFGLSRQDDLRDFLRLGMVFGDGFSDRKEHAWMVRYLADPKVPDPHQRMHRLYTAAIARLEEADASREASAAFDRACPHHGERP